MYVSQLKNKDTESILFTCAVL